ncbi:hypothetical protein Hypma_009825 [Hypsizygus marmoreus]|uniref:Protein kinase domain-containing protein n=1 Tax=Hypsizygus marmoreus TaxID=39966 RepID=A0A369JQT8_HYPMA|nr:hypothetical protein Hypma_009825 [Hypsizygus marmoreus]
MSTTVDQDMNFETASPKDSKSTEDTSPPMFNFPKEPPRTFTAADLIAILAIHNGGFGKNPDKKHNLPTQEEASSDDALAMLSGNSTHKRIILRIWPRSPTGKSITPDNTLMGKQTPNGIELWGATTLDFYHVQRFPDEPRLSTITTGSKLLRWMKANNELEYAQNEIEWAEHEENPKIIDPHGPHAFVEAQEAKIRAGEAGKSMPLAEQGSDKGKSRSSIFDPSNYSSPWPLIPFSYETECLQTLIPLHHLPEKITVHDPWNLLAVTSWNRYGGAMTDDKQADWTSTTDRTHIYKLQPSPAAKTHLLERRLKGMDFPEMSVAPAENAKEKTGGLLGYLIKPTGDVLGPIPPPIFVVHDPPPRRLIDVIRPGDPEPSKAEGLGNGPIEEAHLYISPAHSIGKGNHSVVYEAEWELPRSALFPPPPNDPVLCEKCVEADIKRILTETDGENGEKMEARWREKSAKLSKVFKVERPARSFSIIRQEDLEDGVTKSEDGDARVFLADPGKMGCRLEFDGPVRPIRTTVGWQDPLHPTCQHIMPPPPVPPTAKVRVVAKLSIRGDEQLEQEATNYQDFDRHLFEHWSGLNVMPPMHDPFPVGALVPQFYGYYVPEEEEDVEMGEGDDPASAYERGYLSPILLMEECGRPVHVSDLGIDEKNEVRSLIHRFHHADWTHGSIYARNILAQHGPLNVPPAERVYEKEKRVLSFRLIDFGRSSKYSGKSEASGRNWDSCRLSETIAIEKLLGLGMYSYD